MRYWVYINDKVEGPYEEDKLVTLPGFTPDTLICAEEIAAGGSQEWIKASSIFEFDKIEQTINQPLPSPEVFQTQRAASAGQSSQQAAGTDITQLLLEKMDILTREISGMQTKLDAMQHKLEEAISSAHYTQPAQETSSYMPPQEEAHNTITLTRHELETVNEDALITNTENLMSQAEDIVAAANQTEQKPLDMLGPVDLGEKKPDATPTEVSLGSKAEEEVVLRSALDSLYNAKIVQSQEEKESTFQDLLTPKQAEALAAQSEALRAQKENKPTLDDALKAAPEQAEPQPSEEETTPAAEEARPQDAAATSTPSADEAEKDALLKELSSEPKEDILDQVIKEKEEEKKAEETARLAQAAVAGAAAAAAAEEALQHDASAQPEEQPAPGFETVEEASAEPVEEKQTLDFSQEQQEQPLTIATDHNEPEKQEEVKPASEMPADQPAEEAKPAETAELEKLRTELPSLEESAPKSEDTANAEADKEETLQELVPGATSEKPEGVIITDADLKEAFAERGGQNDQSVEQLFGIASPSAQAAQPHPGTAATDENAHLPQFSDQTADKPLPVGNPNDLTEIELKEGSTYLISDFVPPAQANANELPKELGGLNAKNNVISQAMSTMTTDIQEMVTPIRQTENPAPQPEQPATKQADQAQPAAAETPNDVTVSQVILENTIKTKRGATLDIKTVPMVPEPAQSERLHLDTMVDDINTQHDMKSADIKAPAKTTKIIVGSVAAVVLALLIYAMLAFMNLIPAQFNLFSSGDKAAVEENIQLEEMLGPSAQTASVNPAAAQAGAAVNPMNAILTEVKNYPLANGYTLQQFIEAKHPAAQNLITWDISTAVDPDNYSILVKVPPENPQSFKISYRFNYNTATKALDPTISDAKNLLDSVAQSMGAVPQQQVMPQQQAYMQQQGYPQQQAYAPQQQAYQQPQQVRPVQNAAR